jgi:drug/metabolite transporter (DMT)-like permease
MSWHALAVLLTIPAAAQLLMLRHVARGRKKYNAATVNAVSIMVLYIFGLLVLPLINDTPSLAEAVGNSGWLLLGAVAFIASSIFMYRALEHLAVSIFSILQTMATLFTIVLAVPLLHESFRHYQWVGAAALMVTIWATLYLAHREDSHLEKSANWKKGVGYCVLSSLFLAVAVTNEKHMLSTVSTSTYLIYEWGAQVIIAFAAAFWLGGQKSFLQLYRNQPAFTWILGSGIMRALTAILFIIAQVDSNNIALVSVIANFKIIIIAVFGAFILKERKFFLHKMTTAALALGSLALILH